MGRRLDSAEGLKHTSMDAMQCTKNDREYFSGYDQTLRQKHWTYSDQKQQ